MKTIRSQHTLLSTFYIISLGLLLFSFTLFCLFTRLVHSLSLCCLFYASFTSFIFSLMYNNSESDFFLPYRFLLRASTSSSYWFFDFLVSVAVFFLIHFIFLFIVRCSFSSIRRTHLLLLLLIFAVLWCVVCSFHAHKTSFQSTKAVVL